jgi:O-antigen/teichoic acid export membrane protein
MLLAIGSGLLVLLALAAISFCASRGMRLPMFKGHPESDDLITIGAIQLAISLQAGVYYNLFQGLQEAHWTALYQGLGRLVCICLMIWAALVFRTPRAILIAQLFGTALFGGACALHAWRRHGWIFTNGPWVDREQLAQQLRTGIQVFALQIGRTITASAPTMAISSVLGPAAVPSYTVPYSLLQLLFMPMNAWSTSLHSAYGEAWTSGDRSWVINTFRNSVERGMFWAALGAAIFLPLAKPFIALWTDGRLLIPQFMPTVVVMTNFIAWFLITGQYLLSGLNRQRGVAVFQIFCGLLTILFSFLAIKWVGVVGVGIGVLGGALPTSVYKTITEIGYHISPGALPRSGFVLRIIGLLLASLALTSFLMTQFDRAVSSHEIIFFFLSALIVTTCYLSLSAILQLHFLGELVDRFTTSFRAKREL